MSKLNIFARLPETYDRQTFGEILKEIETQVNLLTEGKGRAYYGARTAAPTTGAWARGDWVKNSAPSSGGFFGWVCTASGEPGTWKGFGTIA